MPQFRVTFMNHIVETYIVEADDEAAAWDTDPADVEDREPERWDCTSCEVTDVEEVVGPQPDVPLGSLIVFRPAE